MNADAEMPHPVGVSVLALLDADPDLGRGLNGRDLAHAERAAVARVTRIATNGREPRADALSDHAGWLGLLIVDGLLMRRVNVGRHPAGELFGAGDLIGCRDGQDRHEPVAAVDWVILQPTRVALLDCAFARRIASWPTITAQLLARVAARADRVALQQSIAHLPGVPPRLLLTFWLLAERWGTVTPDGVRVTLPLTHEMLASLIGAQRPTVTLGLARLRDAGLLIREGPRQWLITNHARQQLGEPDAFDLISERLLASSG